MQNIWSKLSIGKKLFIAIVVTVGVVIVFISVLITLIMRAGFTQYILQAELDRFDQVIIDLAERYDPAQPNWPDFQNNRRAFNALVRNAIPPGGINRPRPKLNGQARVKGEQRAKGQLRAPVRDPLSIGQRVAVLDTDKAFLFGAEFDLDDGGLRDITILDEAGNDQLIGYIILRKPGSNNRGANNGGANARQNGATEIFLNDQIKSLGITLVLAMLLSAIAAYLLARQFTRPVNHLVSGTQRLALGEYDLRLQKTSEDEFGNLVAQFNLLAEQLEANEKAERQWMSDTSHELQTPLAVLRAEIEALQDGIRQPDEKTLSTLHQSVTRLSGLVKDISQLSHAREGRLVATWTTEDISVMAAQAAQKASGLTQEAGLDLQADLKDPIMAECDHMRIGQLLDNILTNARHYTSSPGFIKISTKTSQLNGQDAVTIRVDDSNSKPSDEAMGKLFDRFYREDASRTRGVKKTGGSGLGLAICKLIVEAHNGTILAEESPMGGLAMVIQLPLMRAKE